MRTFLLCFALVCAFASVNCRSTYGEDKALLSRALETLRQNHPLGGKQLRTSEGNVDFELLGLFYGVYTKCVISAIYDLEGDECPHVIKVNEAFMCLTVPGFENVLSVISQYKDAMVCILYDPDAESLYCKEAFSSKHLEDDVILEEMKKIEQIEEEHRRPDCGDESDDTDSDSDSVNDEKERLLTRLLTKMQRYQ